MSSPTTELRLAFAAGFRAWRDGAPPTDNPHLDFRRAVAWATGWFWRSWAPQFRSGRMGMMSRQIRLARILFRDLDEWGNALLDAEERR